MRIGKAAIFFLFVAGIASAQPRDTKKEPPKSEPGKPVEVTLDGLKATAPAGWKQEKPDNLLRAYQFKLSKASGDADDATLYVLTTVQGTPQENITRLKE